MRSRAKALRWSETKSFWSKLQLYFLSNFGNSFTLFAFQTLQSSLSMRHSTSVSSLRHAFIFSHYTTCPPQSPICNSLQSITYSKLCTPGEGSAQEKVPLVILDRLTGRLNHLVKFCCTLSKNLFKTS